jgi:hypothetical protein
MRAMRMLFSAILLCSTAAHAQGNSWDKVRYNGGTLQTKVDPKDWDNHLTVAPDLITLMLKDGQKVTIPTKDVTRLSYGQEAHRRVGEMFVLFGLFHKSRLHYIGVEYTASGKKGALLLQGDKDDYREVLLALETATHAPLSVSEEDRGFVPKAMRATVVNAALVKDSGADTVKTEPKTGKGTLSLTSNPTGADVYVDDDFAGKTPCTLTLDTGKHKVKVIAKGYETWWKELKVQEGSEITLNAGLVK